MRIVQCFACGVEFRTSSNRATLCERLECELERFRIRYNRIGTSVKTKTETIRSETQKEKARERSREWYRQNTEYKKQYYKHYYQANTEKVKALRRAFIERNPDYSREYYYANWQKYNEYRQTAYIEEKAAVETFRQLIGPCFFKDRFQIKKTLQKLVKKESDNVTR